MGRLRALAEIFDNPPADLTVYQLIPLGAREEKCFLFSPLTLFLYCLYFSTHPPLAPSITSLISPAVPLPRSVEIRICYYFFNYLLTSRVSNVGNKMKYMNNIAHFLNVFGFFKYYFNVKLFIYLKLLIQLKAVNLWKLFCKSPETVYKKWTYPEVTYCCYLSFYLE